MGLWKFIPLLQDYQPLVSRIWFSKRMFQLRVQRERKIFAVAMIIYKNFREGCECVTSGREVSSMPAVP